MVLHLSFLFGVDLSPGLADADAFFIRNGTICRLIDAPNLPANCPEEPPNTEVRDDQFSGPEV